MINYVSPDLMGFQPSVNDFAAAIARTAPERLVPFGSVHPRFTPDAAAEVRRLKDLGIRALKVHPPHQLFAANAYLTDLPALAAVYASAEELALPVMIHTGTSVFPGARNRFADPMAADDVAVDFPDLTLILAHAGITDLSWIWRVAADLPNLLFDTAWWMPADLQALFALVPPGQVLFASDAPYGHTLMSAIFQMRSAVQVGLSPAQIRSIASEQSLRIAAREPLQPAGPAIGERDRASHVLLDRVAEYVMLGAIATMRSNEGGPEMLALARMACDVPDGIDDAPVFAAVRSLLDSFDELTAAEPDNRRRLAFLILAANVARTPDVPVPQV